MSWALRGLAGPLKNKVITLRPGLTLGRKGDVVIPDLKASSVHARVSQVPSGTFLLEDNSSKNGTRVDGERINSVKLTDGLIFYIGDQGFEVLEIKEEVSAAPSTAIGRLEPFPPAPPQPKQRFWHEVLAGFLGKNMESFSERPRNVSPLNPALILEFVRGVQVNSRWVLGYGPRKIGPLSLDLPICEPGAPTVCFEILQTPDGIVFKTAHSRMVRVNGQEVDSRVLCVGDTIQINETLIEVDFTE